MLLVPETTTQDGVITYPSPETAGQLYIYAMSSTYKILHTQGLVGDGDDSEAAGINEIAAGMYKCEAKNVEVTDTKEVEIEVVNGELMSKILNTA